MRRAVFLDRDGTIIQEVGYLNQPHQVELLPGAAEAIVRWNRGNVPVVVVTNQAGVARGFFPESRVNDVHRRLDELLGVRGAHIDAYYYCPHHPTAGKWPYRCVCSCRKPAAGMLFNAARELNLDLRASIMVGDKYSDLVAGVTAGCRAVLVRTGYGAQTEATWSVDEGFTPTVVDGLSEISVAIGW